MAFLDGTRKAVFRNIFNHPAAYLAYKVYQKRTLAVVWCDLHKCNAKYAVKHRLPL
jgi:hypothetical protein